VDWSFWAKVSLRNPVTGEVETLTKLVDIGHGQEEVASWVYRPRTSGLWDVRFQVYEDSDSGSFIYSETGWLRGLLAVDVRPQVTIPVVVGGLPMISGSPAFLKDETTLVPLRVLAEALGATLVWDDARKRATLALQNILIELTLDSLDVTINGLPGRRLPVAPTMVGGELYVPLRAVCEELTLPVVFSAGRATISAPPPTTPKATGSITIPISLFFNGAGKPIPIYVPAVGSDGSNSRSTGSDWRTVHTKTWSDLRVDAARFAVAFNPTPVPANVPPSKVFIVAVLSVISSIIQALVPATTVLGVELTVQENPTGDRRAIIQLSYPSWLRDTAGTATDIETLDQFIVAQSLGLAPNVFHIVRLVSDPAHRHDPNVAYLFVDPDGDITQMPKIYPQDRVVFYVRGSEVAAESVSLGAFLRSGGLELPEYVVGMLTEALRQDGYVLGQ
jgi:hypothetical protein